MSENEKGLTKSKSHFLVSPTIFMMAEKQYFYSMEPIAESIFPDRPVQYTSFWNRFVAFFIDCFFVFMTWYIVGLLLHGSAIAGIIDLVVLALYSPLMEAGPRQATLGKTGMRIKVADMDGRRITYGQAFGRHFGKLLSLAIALLGFFMMLWTPKRQTLHDRMAGTIVVTE